MAIIENGGHEGAFKWKIGSDGRGQIDASTQSEDRHINIEHGKVWSLPFEGIDPTGADDYFFYLTNTGSTNLAITDFRLESSVIGTAEVHSVTGTASATNAITPVNRHIGSSTAPTATIGTNVDITGLSNTGVLFWINCDTADKIAHESTSSNIIIPPGQAIALMWDTSTGILKGMVSLVEIV